MTANVLVTGGAGYIGSITCVRLIESGYRPIVYDNHANSHPRVYDHIEQLTGVAVSRVIGDVRDASHLARVFAEQPIDAVIHFAGLKAVGESVAQPLEYYDVNVNGTLCLLRAMQHSRVRKLVFSSSCTVYGEPKQLPLTEASPLAPASPYGNSKLAAERLIHDVTRAERDWASVCLRYFNPVGAHPSGQMGEDPRGIPNNLMPFLSQVAVGRRECVQIYGDDYPTVDGTGVRDYIHVLDLADGHIAALRFLDAQSGAHCFNLGTGAGHSVLQVIAAFEQACGQNLPKRTVARRPGDVVACFADCARAEQMLDWRAQRDLAQMCADSWHWQRLHPNGYAG